MNLKDSTSYLRSPCLKSVLYEDSTAYEQPNRFKYQHITQEYHCIV